MQSGVSIQRTGGRQFPMSPVSFSTRQEVAGLRATSVDTLQVNVGKLCNQACKHCHVDASPARTEIISRKVVDACLKSLIDFKIPTLDITGGAPELIPDFRYFVIEARKVNTKVIVRHNLTVMFEPGQENLAEFFAENGVELISSLPYFNAEKTDRQRGTGVFGKSIDALKLLNSVGFGTGDFTLNLVYNPVGAFLPPEQEAIEADFRREMMNRYGVSFDRLFTITNMPIARFLDWLRRSKNEERYMNTLVNAFNPSTVAGLMCRNLISVDWNGRLFDCDFNQMLDLAVDCGQPETIFDFDLRKLESRRIVMADHCFGCTAGSGSSCGGAVAT